jgi:hypothetical protein
MEINEMIELLNGCLKGVRRPYAERIGLEKIRDFLNTLPPPIDNRFVAEGCEKFSTLP